MAVDSATHIASFDTAKPSGSDPRSELDNNIRHIKSVLLTDFPNIAGAVTASHTELNYVDGVTSAIQTQLDAKAPLASPALTGTPTAPTATAGTGTTQVATTAFVQAAVAAVNAQTGIVASYNSAASFSISDGQIVAATNAGAVAADMSSAWAVGAVRGVIFDAALNTSTVNLGTHTVKGWNGATVTGTLTCDQPIPVILRNFGDYLRPV